MQCRILFIFFLFMWYTSVFAIPEGLESQERKKAFMNEESKVNFRSAVIPLQQDSPTSQKGLTHYHTFLTPKQSPSYIDISGFKNAMYQLHNDLNLLDSQADNLETSVSVGSLERFQVVGTEIIFELEYSAMELNHVASRLSKHAKALSRLSSRLRNIHTGISYPSGGGGGGSSNRHIPNAEPIHEPLPHHFTEQHERRDGTQPPQNYLRHLENSPSSPSTPGNQREELHIESINQRPHPEEIPVITIYTDYMPMIPGNVYPSHHEGTHSIVVCINMEDYKYLKVYFLKMIQYLSDPNEATSCARDLYPMFSKLGEKMSIHKLTLPKNTPLKCMFTSDYLVIETRFSAVSSVLRPFYENNFSNFQIRRMEARRKCSVLLQELQERPFDLRVPEFRYVPAPPKMPPSTPIPPCPPNSRKCTPPTRADVPTDVQQKY